MRTRTAVAAALFALICPTNAQASGAWGDAELKGDDVRIELDGAGRADVVHTVGLHVSAKRFRAFTIDGVDEGIEPPADEATSAGRDGPGWPAVATDAKGLPVDAFVEPAKESRKLRVRLGVDGIGRGNYTIRVHYRVDLAKKGAFTRDGALVRLTWSPPRWPEGYDGARIVFVLPSAPTEPKVSIADADGEGEHGAEGVAIVSLRRGPTRDEIEITRPHVPQHDDTKWIVRLDPKAVPGIAAAKEDGNANEASMGTSARDRRVPLAFAGGLALLLAVLLGKRDRDAAAAAGPTPYRPLLPVSAPLRALSFGACSGLAVLATLAGQPRLSGLLIVAAMLSAWSRAPLPIGAQRLAGRWLGVPEASLPRARRTPNGLLDFAMRPVAAGIALVAFVAAIVLLARHAAPIAVGVAMHAALLLPLLFSASARQLPLDRARDGWAKLEPIAKALAAFAPRVIARVTKKGIDEVRLRMDGDAESAVRAIEIGCAIVHGSGGCSAVPEVLVRVDAGSELGRRIAAMPPGATSVVALGRSEDERVLCIRPESSDPAALVDVVRWARSLDARSSETPRGVAIAAVSAPAT